MAAPTMPKRIRSSRMMPSNHTANAIARILQMLPTNAHRHRHFATRKDGAIRSFCRNNRHDAHVYPKGGPTIP